MSFEAHEQRLKNIFVGDSSFIIPRNQRNYVWEEKNWKEFANDIEYVLNMMDAKKNISHFIGSFVFQQNDDEYIIIDGQQRITTIMIMLSAICTLQNELGDEEGFGKTKQYLVGNIGLKSEYQRLSNEAISNLELIIGQATIFKKERKRKKVFEGIPLAKNSKPNKDIVSCFWFFYNYFIELCGNEIELLERIRSIIVEMKVIHIISEDELDCYEVFEILNARGVSLKDSELMKNYIFKYVQPESTIDIAKVKWDTILNNMSECNDNIEQFLTHYFIARFQKITSNINVFQLVKDNIPKKDINNLLDELVICSELYIYFYHPEKHKNKIISECLQFFRLENQRQFRPIFMSYLLAFNKKLISEKELEKAFILIRNFYFSFGLICKNTSNIIESGVYTVANRIYNSISPVTSKEFCEKFAEYLPAKDTFINNFMEKGYSNKNSLYTNSKNKKEIYYILSKFEEYYQNKQGGELMCDLSSCNVEHINSDSKLEDIPCKIGNLLLIAQSINSSVGNESFLEKKNKYENSKLCNVQMFLKHYGDEPDWNDDLIMRRGKKMAELAFNEIWRFE